MDYTTVEPGTRASFVIIGRDELNALKAAQFELAQLGTLYKTSKAIWETSMTEQGRVIADLREDHTSLGEAFESSKERVTTLEGELAEANTLIGTLRASLTDANISAAASRQALDMVRGQLKDAKAENNTLHNELAKARQTKATTWNTWMDAPKADAFASEKQTQDTRDDLSQMAYPDAELAREAGVSELTGEGESE